MKILGNKRGQAIFAGIMIFITVFIVIVQLITPIKDQITSARNPAGLDCENVSITTMTKATCIVVDTTLFYFVGMALAGGAAFLTGRIISRRT